MHTLVPFGNNARARAALDEAVRMAQLGDAITVIAVVTVPAYYAPDVEPGIVWVQTCYAERHLNMARSRVRVATLPEGVEVRYVHVQARDAATAIVRGAEAFGADVILFVGRAGVWDGVARKVGTVGAVARHAPCGVRVTTTAHRPAMASPEAATVPEHTPIHNVISHLFGGRAHHVHGR